MSNKFSEYKSKINESLNNSKSGSNDSFLSRARDVKSLFNKKSATQQINNDLNASGGDLMEKVDALINEMPSELMDKINKEINFCLKNDCSPEEMQSRVEDMISLLKLSYADPRGYLEMYGRHYHELLMRDYISEICEIDSEEADWYRVARVSFDLQGLRTVNEFGVNGRSSGNELLERFTNLLENGETVSFLKEKNVRVRASAEGGDDFGWVILAPFDLRSVMDDIVKMFIDEVESLDVSDLIDFNNDKVRSYLSKLGEEDSPKKFISSVSVGYVVLGELIGNFDSKECQNVVQDLANKMFRIAHERCNENKARFKSYLKDNDPGLYTLFGREHLDILEERIAGLVG